MNAPVNPIWNNYQRATFTLHMTGRVMHGRLGEDTTETLETPLEQPEWIGKPAT